MIKVKQYEQAIKTLSERRKEILSKLYYIEPAKNAVEIADKLGYKGPGGANLQLGNIGKAICDYLKVTPDHSGYNDSILERGYFIVIHRQFRSDIPYWDMETNLRHALE